MMSINNKFYDLVHRGGTLRFVRILRNGLSKFLEDAINIVKLNFVCN